MNFRPRSYFVESPQSLSLLEGGFKIIAGRKGTGKSALAHVTHDRLEEQAKTAVRVITPKGYELKQVLEIVKNTRLQWADQLLVLCGATR